MSFTTSSVFSFFFGSGKPQQKSAATYEPPEHALLHRELLDGSEYYSRIPFTHHFFADKLCVEKRLTPVMYNVTTFKPRDNTTFDISFDKLDVLGAPFIRITDVSIEHSSPCLNNVTYDGVAIPSILLDTRQVDNNVYMTKVPINGFQCCYYGKTEKSILVQAHHNGSMSLHVEYVQAAGGENALLHNEKNKQCIQCTRRVNAKPMEKVYSNSTSSTFEAILNPLKSKYNPCDVVSTYVSGIVLATPAKTKVNKISLYVRDKETNECTLLRNELSPTFAADKFKRDPLKVIEQKGYVGYTFSLTNDNLFSTPQRAAVDLPPGSIDLKKLHDRQQELVFEVDMSMRQKDKIAYVCPVITSFTNFYIE